MKTTQQRLNELREMPIDHRTIEAYVGFIEEIANEDCEVATLCERELWQRVLEVVANANTGAFGSMAHCALQTKDMDFPRRG